MRRSLLILPVSALLTIVLVGCGTEVGRIPFDDIGEGRTEVMIDASKEVDFWTDLDLEKEEDISLAASILGEEQVSLVYSIALYQGGELVRRLACDPFDVSSFDLDSKFKSVDVSLRTTRSFKYKGKMRCSISVPNSGAMVVEAALAPVNPSDGSLVDLPDSFNLSKADLVIKQK